LSSPADKKLFGALRGLADVVVVGASTVREEGYRPPQPKAGYADARAAAGRLPVPVIAIVTRSLGLDFSAPLFTEALVPPVILTCSSADPDALERARAVADVVVAGDEEVDLAQAVKILAARGWTRMLTEGGPHLLAGLVAAEVVDEVCLALGPLLTAGDATRMLAGPLLETPQRFGLESLLEEDGFLFGRYVRRTDG
jgi:riboflavin biosynthesis pyrimidine reductase